MGRKIFFWILLIIYSIMIFIFSSRPEVGVGQYFYGQDKVMHFVVYGIHTFLCLAALSDKILLLKLFHYFLALIFSVSYGIFNEIYQYFIPEREFSLGDILANGLGIITFLILVYIFQNKKRKKVTFCVRHKSLP
ncbi:MAG: VanZ family protein [Candidatus Atribacteria bacterium]|nr:VanZ family protein [Candidatus Atribacteria bacterium]